MKKRILSMLLALAMVLGLMPNLGLTAEAADITYDLWVGGKQVTPTNLTITGSEGTATYDPDTNTLTLNNYTYSGTGHNNAAIYYGGTDTLNLNLIDENHVTSSGGSDKSYGVYASGSISVTGGSLSATGGSVTGVSGNSYGVYASGSISVTGVSLSATGGSVTGDYGSSYGVYASGSISVAGGGLSATGGSDTCNSYGVYADSITVLGDSSLYGTGGQAIGDSCGMYAENKITIEGGETIAKGDTRAFVTSPSIADTLAVYDVDDKVIASPVWTGEGALTYAKIAEKPATPVASVTAGGVTTNYTDIAEAITAAKASEGSTLKLLDDITTDATITINSGSFTLDLNGCTLSIDTFSDVLDVASGADLTIDDRSDGVPGIIRGPLGVVTVSGGELTVLGGKLYSLARDVANRQNNG